MMGTGDIIDTNKIGFPDSVDKLRPEIGEFTGPRPVMFREFSVTT